MKLSVFFLILGLTASARGTSQRVRLNMKNVPVQEVFREVIRQTGTSIIYNEAIFADAPPVTIKVENATVEEVLQKCFKGQPYTFEVEGNSIYITKKPNLEITQAQTDQGIDISGRVTDKDGHPLQGASITVKGKKEGTETDANGVFVLKGLSADDEITVSYTEYASQTFKVGATRRFVVSLEHSDNPLDQVQVIAYGKQTKRFSASDISTVSAAEIGRQDVNNPLLALEGKVPGMLVTQSNGLPGSGVTVLIQGQNSLNYGNDPLYVIDGLPYASQRLSTNLDAVLGVSGLNPQTGSAQNGSPLSYLNPYDIESITVLKDADATAIYGSRAANGAIIITTKKGKVGKPKFEASCQSGWGVVPRNIGMMDTRGYMQTRRIGKMIDNLAVSSTDYDINGIWDTTRYTDWQKKLIGSTAHYDD
ncbi:MAG: TonB-dependent receptor plug domain-containing protein, partial [Bacteroidota bacterium]|nr:TonB-dependent receptor plug domain-containing protein [Bacteroidota bacterium]